MAYIEKRLAETAAERARAMDMFNREPSKIPWDWPCQLSGRRIEEIKPERAAPLLGL
jgi:hypothetical protein